MDKEAIQQLEKQVDELLSNGRRSREENKLLITQQAALLAERAQLIEKTNLARNKIDSMIDRLKAMDDEL